MWITLVPNIYRPPCSQLGRIRRAISDHCLLLERNFLLKSGQLTGIVILHVDDSFSFVDENFVPDDQKESQQLLSKPRPILTTSPTTINDMKIAKTRQGAIINNQPNKIAKMEEPEGQKEFTSQRALAQYLYGCTRPEVCTNIELISPDATEATKEDYNTLRKTIRYIKATINTGLTFQGYTWNR